MPLAPSLTWAAGADSAASTGLAGAVKLKLFGSRRSDFLSVQMQ